MDTVAEPAKVYEKRLEDRRARAHRMAMHDALLANVRLGVAVVAVVFVWAVFAAHALSRGWLWLPALMFVALVLVHDRVIRRYQLAERAVRFYERGLARLGGNPIGGSYGERFLDPEHPYAADLDLFGRGSLFERLCTAETLAGEEALAGWLLAPAASDEVRARQSAVRELTPKLDLREDLFLLGSDVRAAITPQVLINWGEAPQRWRHPAIGLGLGTLLLSGLASLLAWAAGWGPLPLLAQLVVAVAVNRALSRSVHAVFATVERPARELLVLARILERFEKEPLREPKLSGLQTTLVVEGRRGSREIRRLVRLLELADARRNQLFAPMAYLLVWSPLFAWLLERWRGRAGRAVRAWLTAVGELEALGAFATYAFEAPLDIYPEIVDDGPSYEATGLTHPLLPPAAAVRNDVRLGKEPALLVVSGSNMSGKSTLLRSVGVSVAMALAGAPVRASALRLSPLAMGATLRIQDSLQAGRSRFYAEVRRLKALLDLTGSGLPLLFLLDELLHGTNSHDRREGARAVLMALLERRAVGLVTTHDLALTELAASLGPRAQNVHFVDSIDNGQLHFDYRMHAGVVRESNALALMRAVGLPL